MLPLALIIFGIGADTKIGSSIVQGVSVDMINLISSGWLRNKTVKVKALLENQRANVESISTLAYMQAHFSEGFVVLFV